MASTTDTLLAEIGVSTAAELAMGVGYTSPTFIPELDTLLLSARPHAGGSSLQRGDLVELTGPSGSGKTTFAAFLLLTTILPPTLDIAGTSVPLGGRGMCAALLCPLSHPPNHLRSSLRSHIERCILKSAAYSELQTNSELTTMQHDVEKVVDAALRRLVVLRPRPRAAHWAVALRRLLSPGPNDDAPALVVLDGLGDGFWPERWADETKPPKAKPHGAVRTAEDAGMRDVWDAMTALRAQLGAVVVVTVQGLRPAANGLFKPHLPAPYPAPFQDGKEGKWPLNVHITMLGPARTLQLPAESTLAEALRARRAPDVAMYHGVVRVPGGAGPVGTPSGARFAFGVESRGLVPFNAK